jgi:uncharacterized repeat protein (TIGR02543 family)
LPANPIKEGYTFGGWYWDPGTWILPFTANSLLHVPLAIDMSVHAMAVKYCGRYTLKGIVIRTGVHEMFIDPLAMSPSEVAAYSLMLDMYGRTVEIGNTEIHFEGLVLGAFTPAAYTLTSAGNVVFADTTLRTTFTFVTLTDGIFTLGIISGTSIIAFEYHSPDFVPPAFKLIFDYNGATGGDSVADITVPLHATLSNLPSPTRTGYTFVGWRNETTGAVNNNTRLTWREDRTFVAQWTANTYRLNYNYGGATGGNSSSFKNVTFATQVGALPTPTRTNYNFVGWFTEPNGAGTEVTSSFVWNEASDQTIYAYWVGQPRTLNFNYQGATANNGPADRIILFGEAVGELPTPTKTGNIFRGWFSSSGGWGTEYNENTLLITSSSLTVFAKWETTLTFDYVGTTGGNSQVSTPVVFNASFGTLPSPTRTGFTFNGWYSEQHGMGTGIQSWTTYTAAAEMTIFASWDAVVTFDYQNATGNNWTTSITATLGRQVGTLPAPTRTGYTFSGWFSGANGVGTQYTNSTVFSNEGGAMTLFANWIANQYTLSFDFQGGSGSPSSKAVTFDSSARTQAVTEKSISLQQFGNTPQI